MQHKVKWTFILVTFDLCICSMYNVPCIMFHAFIQPDKVVGH